MRFEEAADAIVTGDASSLTSLLAEDAHLVQARSERSHRATLLHYVGANGVEQERQESPGNAVEMARILLEAGAAVDALADIYGQSTTLGLVASSIHPKRAGVQIPLLDLFLAHGAYIDGVAGHAPLLAALRNGRKEAAEHLAHRGATLTLEGAAGVGRLEAVAGFFHPDGSLTAKATRSQLDLGLLWASQYGRLHVLHFLLDHGADPQADGGTGLTALHWAVVGASLEAIQLLLERGAALEAVNRYGGTPLGQALWFILHGDPAFDYEPVITTLLHAGARVDDDLLAWFSSQSDSTTPQTIQILKMLKDHAV